MNHIKLFENFNKECKIISDEIRISLIGEELEKWNKDTEYKEYCSGEPEMDSLLDPWDGYDNQTYIQYVNDDTIIFWEGWSSLCWEGAYTKDIYKDKTKEEILNHIKSIRFPYVAKELNMKIVSFDYWFEESWTDGVDDGYIMKITLTKKP
jgi:hypothetical protein